MAKSLLTVVLVSASLLSTQALAVGAHGEWQHLHSFPKAAGSANRKLLADEPLKAVLTDTLCAVTQIDAIVSEFLGLNKVGLGGLPAVLNAVTTLDNKIETEIEKALGIVPPKSCSVAPKTVALDDILAEVYCSVVAVDKKLTAALKLGRSDDVLIQVVNDLVGAASAVEADAVLFLTGITCA